jgi:hypothetical protein
MLVYPLTDQLPINSPHINRDPDGCFVIFLLLETTSFGSPGLEILIKNEYGLSVTLMILLTLLFF